MNSSDPDGWVQPARTPARYELLEELGRGGMGVVYRARDLKLNRIIALKFLQSTDAEEARRFLREGQMAAQLAHPNIVPIHEVGEHEGKQFLAMEYIDGKTLDHVKLDPRKAAEAIATAAGAVQHAHDKGIIHRDIKPGNLILRKDGHLWVMDFGLARPIAHGTTLTVTGSIVGTPAYMSPEQALGLPCDARSDVYSLGATLYELLTRRPPFDAPNPLEILELVRDQDPVPPRRLNPNLARELETITLKALEKDPDRRYATAGELSEDLRRHLAGDTILGKPPGALRKVARVIRRRRALTIPVGAVLAFALGLLTYSLVRTGVRTMEKYRLMREAESATRERDWRKAADLLAEAQKLAPGDGSVERKRRAAEEMDRAIRALAARDAARERIRSASLPGVEPHDPASTKEKRWTLEEEVERLKREAFAREQEAEQAALAALTYDATIAEARRFLAEIYLARYEEALPAQDAATIEWWADRARLLGGEEFGHRIDAPATLVIRTRPAGATAYLFQYRETQHRLVPDEVSAVDALPLAATDEERRRSREGTAYPLRLTNAVAFPLRLKPGSYLVLLRKEGFADTRLPLLLGRGARVDVECRLLRPQDIPPGFVYVPAGTCILGGDPEASERIEAARPRRTEEFRGYLIKKFAVTAAEYLEYVNDRSWHSHDAAIRRLPRAAGRGSYWPPTEEPFTHRLWPPDEPIVAVSFQDAEDFARWATKRHKGRWTFRPPTADEWEKAARGADGRFYPWGNRYDAAFCATRASRAGFSDARNSPGERIGLFPADESPFGVRDLAGVACAWTSTAAVEGGAGLIVKGGDWQSTANYARSAANHSYPYTNTLTNLGIRLVADLPEE